jgi:hypothetical protein
MLLRSAQEKLGFIGQGTKTRPFQELARKIKIHNSKTDAKISMSERKRV